MRRLLEAWRARQQARALQRRAIPESLWQLTLARFPFLAWRSADDLARLRTLTALFLDQKEFTGAQGLQVDDSMAVAIAAQAVLPVLNRPEGLQLYSAFVGIVVHPDEVVAQREVMDDDGVVHRYTEPLSGEAMLGGPVMLSWPDVSDAAESAEWGYNVVIHEFAHVIDMVDGEADGVPPMADVPALQAWVDTIVPLFEQFCAAVDAGEDTLLDPYGASSLDEFFAVAAEAFFVAPKALRAEQPDLYGLLARYFLQDPALHGA